MENPTLDEITKECCKVCGIYRCKNHLNWRKCESCPTTWDWKIFVGCPKCLEVEKKDPYRHMPKESCIFCARKIEDGETAFTDATPGGTFCAGCAWHNNIYFWTITVKHGRQWTVAEILAERQRVG